MALSGKSLDAATSAGGGVAIVPDTPKQVATMAVTKVGTPTFSMALEGSIEENWFSLNTQTSTSGAAPVSTQYEIDNSAGLNFVPSQGVFVAFRANLTAFADDGSGTSSVSASIAIKE